MAGTHACAVPDNFQQAFATAAAFLSRGLEKNQRCLFIANDNGPEIVRMALKSHGLAVDGLEQAGRLAVVNSVDTPLGGRTLEKERLYQAWAAKTDEALSLGFTGLRVVVEMTWALKHDPATLAADEARAGPVFEAKPLDALCLYNRNVFQAHVISAAAIGGHSAFYADGSLSPLSADALRRALDLS